MTVYHPDSWVIVELQTADSKHHRVLSGWVGGWAKSDAWKLSSGIERIEDMGNTWHIFNMSGSVYVCNKHRERFSMLTRSIYNQYQQQNSALKHEMLLNILTLYTV